MSDESPDNDQVWWMPADQPDPAEHEAPAAGTGWLQPTRPIGPPGLRAGARRPYIIAGVAVAALLGGAGAAVAATHSSTPAASSSALITSPTSTPTPTSGLPGMPDPKNPRFHRFGPGLGFGLFGALHGQFVIGKSGGGYQTIDVQTGQVTAVSSTSITLKSADGFTSSYVVTSSTVVDAQRDGIGSVKVGNQASVQATVSGSTATAVSLEDLTLLQTERPAFGMAPIGNPGAQAG
jgi:hypothetical protein